MDFRNRRSKIYSVGALVLGLGAIIPNLMVSFGDKGNLGQVHRLINMGQIFLGLLFILLGTQSVFATKSKLGYLYYVVSIFIFMSLALRLRG